MSKKDTQTEAKNAKFVTLQEPIKRGTSEISEITVMKPTVPALKGLKMFDLLQLDTDAYITLLPRITLPSINKNELLALDPADFTELTTATIGFFVKPEAEVTATLEA